MPEGEAKNVIDQFFNTMKVVLQTPAIWVRGN